MYSLHVTSTVVFLMIITQLQQPLVESSFATTVSNLQVTCMNTIAGGVVREQPVGSPRYMLLDLSGSPVLTAPNAVFRLEADGSTLTTLAGNGLTSGFVDGLGTDVRFNGLKGITTTARNGIVVGMPLLSFMGSVSIPCAFIHNIPSIAS